MNEYWLRDQIFENPTMLGLGELEAIDKERRQSSGGRLDILLKNPEDDTMYEVELMLGETDETHIIRTIEFWDTEKRRWPQRQHYAVLVVESITRRFFNVIHLLSNSIPIIAIQASLLNVNGTTSLFFTKVLDTFEEVEDGTSITSKDYNEQYWLDKAKWTLETTRILSQIVKEKFPDLKLNYTKNYISISVNGYNYFRLHKRSAKKTFLKFRIAETLREEVAELLDEQNLPYMKRGKDFQLTIDQRILKENSDLFEKIAEHVRSTWRDILT